MEFFKHDTTMLDDTRVNELLCKFGAVGYAVYVAVLEIISKDISSENNACELKNAVMMVSHKLWTSPDVVSDVINEAVSLGLISSNGDGSISCIKILSRLDTNSVSNAGLRSAVSDAKKKVKSSQKNHEDVTESNTVLEKNITKSSQNHHENVTTEFKKLRNLEFKNTHTINQIQCVNEIPQNIDAEEEICVCEDPFSQTSTESETSEVVETLNINQTYAEKVYETWHENKLPEGNGGFIAFLQRDFKTGISELRQQRLHSDDVIQAIKNYALVLNNSCYFWSAAFYFSDFVKQKNITRFLPERFNAEMYLDKTSRWDSAVKKSGADTFTGEVPF